LSGTFYLILLGLSSALGAAASLGLFPDVDSPSALTPFPFHLVLLAFTVVPPLLLPIGAGCVSAFWCLQIGKGEPAVPRRTIVLAWSIAAGSLVWFVANLKYGSKYQGLRFVWATAILSALLMLVAAAALFYARKRPSLAASTFSHGVLFLWFFSYAFPYFGEMP
jgi:hypothetical protein